MPINKVMDSVGNILIDLSGDTVTSDKVVQGYTFHDRSGTVQTGTAIVDVHGNPHEDWVMFFDYDGTLVGTWTYEELQQANALPSGPDHTSENLTFDGWNYTLADLLEQPVPIVVGACYKTTDDITYIYYKDCAQSVVALNLELETGTTCTVDWGDETTSTITTTSTTNHNYSTTGDYVIKITSTGNYKLGRGNSSGYPLLGPGANYYLIGIKTSKYVTGLKNYCFYFGYNLEFVIFSSHCQSISGGVNLFYYICKVKTIIIPRGATALGNYFCYQLTNARLYVVSIPNTIISLGDYVFQSCSGVRYISFPKSITTISNNASPMFYLSAVSHAIYFKKVTNNMFAYAFNVPNVVIDDWNFGNASTNAFSYTTNLNIDITIPYGTANIAALHNSWFNKVTLPSTVSSINYSLCYIKILDISSHETPPTLPNTSYLIEHRQCPKIIIGHGTMSLYQNATNWSTLYSYGLLEEATE